MNSEPVISAQMISAFVGAFIGLLVAFNVPVSNEQREAVLTFIPPAFVLVTTFAGAVWARGRVTPVDKLKDNGITDPNLVG